MAGKYVVERVLGSGGMGVVVAAQHLQLGERVALKFLLAAGDASPSEHPLAARFLREAQLAVRIKSPHVARVLDIGTLEDGAPYMVMELLEGVDLDRLLRNEGPLPMGVAADYLLQACEAVAEAHSLGIVHRDLKPANLFLIRQPDGSPLVKVLDFGISKLLEEFRGPADRSLTRADDLLGSPQYMAPEQMRDPRGVDARCDIFSLGSILYKLLTARPAFEGANSATVLALVLSEPPTPIREHLPDIPPALEALVLGCLAKDPAVRVQSVEDFARALVPFAPRRPRRYWGESESVHVAAPTPLVAPLTMHAVTLSSPSPDPTASASHRRSRSVLAGAAAALVVLGMGLALLSFRHIQSAPRASAAVTTAAASPDVKAAEPSTTVQASAPLPSSSAAAILSAPSVATIALPVVPSASAPGPRRPPKGAKVVDPLEDRQ